MKYLSDREKIKSSVFLDYAAIGNDQPIDPTNPYYSPELAQRAFDPDKAKFHLKKADIGGARLPSSARRRQRIRWIWR